MSLEQLLQKRPVNREQVDEHKTRMMAEVRAHRLLEIRKQYALTQGAVAKQMHLSQRRVSYIERGDIGSTQVDTIRKYVEALGGTLKIEVEVGGDSFQIA